MNHIGGDLDVGPIYTHTQNYVNNQHRLHSSVAICMMYVHNLSVDIQTSVMKCKLIGSDLYFWCNMHEILNIRLINNTIP